MRRLSRLTQVEFAKHRGISLGTLKELESGNGSPKVETLNKIGVIFGLEINFVRKARETVLLTAHITADATELKAKLSDGRILVAADPRALAAELVVVGLAVDNVHCADWREGDIAPTAGQAIAIKAEMRRLKALR